ncbi:TetR/AcrR family transcriptional regulator [Umezakia ovalisporum]|uniref:TetR/AcrR family transcriptional regulator n=1 Tax=Umezakia ovalisporum TaxID=75695 RepID=UPI0035BB10CC
MPKIVDHDQYRKELLGKCFNLFAQKGYASLTMRQISESLNVSTGTLYHYFPNKQSLFEQLVEEISQHDISSALAEIKGAQTLSEKMTAIGKFLVKNEDYFINQTYILVDFYQHQDKETIYNNPVFESVNQSYQQAVFDFLGVEDSVLTSFVLSFINGLILGKLYCDKTIDFNEQCALIGKILTQYLQNQNT